MNRNIQMELLHERQVETVNLCIKHFLEGIVLIKINISEMSSLPNCLFFVYRKISIFFLKIAFDFCRLCVVIRFFIPATTANDLRLRRIFIPDVIHYFFVLFKFFRNNQYFPFNVECQTRELLVPFF